MQYWKGSMNWPLDINWKCETCGTGPFMLAGFMTSSNLTWGLIHAQCRCDTCHTIYTMRDENKEVVAVPISRVKEEYKEAVKILWEKEGTPLSEMMTVDLDALVEELT